MVVVRQFSRQPASRTQPPAGNCCGDRCSSLLIVAPARCRAVSMPFFGVSLFMFITSLVFVGLAEEKDRCLGKGSVCTGSRGLHAGGSNGPGLFLVSGELP